METQYTKTIKLSQENMFYKINNISYSKIDDDDKVYELIIFLLSENGTSFNLNESLVNIKILTPDYKVITKELEVINEETGKISLLFLKNELLKDGRYEAQIEVVRKSEKFIFQKFLFNIHQHKGLSNGVSYPYDIVVSETEPSNKAEIWLKPIG